MTTEDQGLARGRLGEPEQQPQGGRLAGAVGTKEAGDGSRVEREREVVDRDDLAEALGQRAYRDHRIAGVGTDEGVTRPIVDASGCRGVGRAHASGPRSPSGPRRVRRRPTRLLTRRTSPTTMRARITPPRTRACSRA